MANVLRGTLVDDEADDDDDVDEVLDRFEKGGENGRPRPPARLALSNVISRICWYDVGELLVLDDDEDEDVESWGDSDRQRFGLLLGVVVSDGLELSGDLDNVSDK